MNVRHIRLIASREIRDQLRDRRMLFLFIVLPLLMYPLLGMSVFQMQQFVREQATTVAVLGAENLPDTPALIDNDRFAKYLFREPAGWEPSRDPEEQKNPEVAATRRANRLVVTTLDPRPGEEASERAARLLSEYDVVLAIPAGFKEQLAAFQDGLRAHRNQPGETAWASKVAPPEIYYDSAKDKSQAAEARVGYVLGKWTDATVRSAVGTDQLPFVSFALAERDLAQAGHKGVAAWSRIFPFLLIVWALTGAFQPAVDLCAGEKERGTLETLLVSPASRQDLVAGKLLAITFFSMATVLINVLSLGMTAHLILNKIQTLGAPPTIALVWLLLALPPLSIFFSALCLGLSAFARSAKEGNYYMVPLFLVMMPMLMSVMSPSADLTLGKSLIPIAGMALLLRVLIEGDYAAALPHVLPVLAVTVACAVVATRWAVGLFSRETVLFRESERFDLALWAHATWRDRGPLPTPGAAMVCALGILVLRFLITFALPTPTEFPAFALQNSLAIIAVMALPAVGMAFALTRQPAASLRLRTPAWFTIPLAALLAVLVHPLVIELRHVVEWMYPIDKTIYAQFEDLIKGAELWMVLIALALVPAICEELAFRGFILTGLEPAGRLTAVVVSSFFFGVVHFLLQQSILAGLLGMLLAYIALATRSLWPCMVYHGCHNSLAILAPGWLAEQARDQTAVGTWLLRAGSDNPEHLAFQWPVVAAAGLLAALVCWLLAQKPAELTPPSSPE